MQMSSAECVTPSERGAVVGCAATQGWGIRAGKDSPTALGEDGRSSCCLERAERAGLQFV